MTTCTITEGQAEGCYIHLTINSASVILSLLVEPLLRQFEMPNGLGYS